MIHLLFIVLGLTFGSFLNVLIYRLPLNKTFIFSRSMCPNCKNFIPLYRNIPIFTFLFQLGKCHHCYQKISVHYIFVEFLCGFLWYWAYTQYNFNEALLFIVMTHILIVISFIDYQKMEIEPKLILVSILILVLHGTLITGEIKNILLGSLVGFSYLGLIFFITSIIFQKETMGLGDLQLITILGGWVGAGNILVSIFLASILGIVTWTILNKIYGYEINRHIPFAPQLCLSATVIYMLKIDIFNYFIGF
tara:strand:- start:1070 stop:1819 length:750 start_codon:yes stop_codon:yes gene_type:complete